MRLLAEMGTLKNLRRASIKKVGSKLKPPISVRIKSSADKNMNNNNETFLTSNRDDFDDDDTASVDVSKFSMNGEDQNQNDKNFQEYVHSISKILDTDRRSNKMDRSYSYSDLLKLRFNYDSIYTNTGAVDRGNRSFYPVYKKFMYLLDKNALKHSFNESANNGTISRAESPTSPTSPTMLNVANEDNNITVHISNVRYTDSPGSISPTGSPPRTIKSQNSNISIPQQQESFLFGSTVAGTVVGTVDSIKPSNTFLNDSLNIEGGSSTYLNKLVKNLTSEQAFIAPYSYADEKPKRGIKYFEPSKNEVYQLDPYLVDTSMSNIMVKSKSKLLKASSSIGNGKDPHIVGLRTSTLIHKSSTAKLKLNAAFKVPNPNPNLNPNLKPNFKDLPPLISKKMKMSESK